MTFKTFVYALLASFGFPWLMLVVVPFAKMRKVDSVHFTEEDDAKSDVYVPRRHGRIKDGSEVYGANGCYVCHSQLIRPSFAGSELGRPGWAGFQGVNAEGAPIDTRRETTPYDYVGEDFAHIGLMRSGPDLSNVGGRIERYVKDEHARITDPETWVFAHLYNPRKKFLSNQVNTYWSTCPSQRHLFRAKKSYGQGNPDAVPGFGGPGEEVVPTDEARALASYLLSLQKDDEVPYAIDYSRDKTKAP